jgi:hypothetical protein
MSGSVLIVKATERKAGNGHAAMSAPEAMSATWRQAAEHEGKALFVCSVNCATSTLREKGTGTLVLVDNRRGCAMIGRIVGYGERYSAAIWPVDDPYQPAPEFAGTAHKLWLKLDDVRLESVADLSRLGFRNKETGETEPVADVLARRGQFSTLYAERVSG